MNAVPESPAPRPSTGPPHLPPQIPPKRSRPPELVYVTGSHRSGGTILGVLLSAHPEIFFPGELNRFPVPAWDPGRLCSCGAPLRECALWSKVVGNFADGNSLVEMRRGQVRFELWRSMPVALVSQLVRTRPLRKHVTQMAELLEEIARQTGKRVIVDASRDAVRGRVASMLETRGFRVRYLHIVRDGRSYLWAETYRPDGTVGGTRTWRHAPMVLAARWVATNLFPLLLCYGGSRRYLRIRFEDLTTRPAEVLARIGGFLDLDMSDVIAKVTAQEPLPIVHVLGGSRFRFQGTTTLRREAGTPDRLTAGARATFWVVAGWLAGFFGYRVRESK